MSKNEPVVKPQSDVLLPDVAALMTLSINLQRLTMRQHKKIWRELALSGRGMFILELVEAGLDRPYKLAAYFDVLPSTITFETKKLVAAGLLIRESDASDRRSTRLRLTDQGRVVHVEITDALNTLLKPRIARLSRDEFEVFTAVFSKMIYDE